MGAPILSWRRRFGIQPGHELTVQIFQAPALVVFPIAGSVNGAPNLPRRCLAVAFFWPLATRSSRHKTAF
jgi:hypothetical protein